MPGKELLILLLGLLVTITVEEIVAFMLKFRSKNEIIIVALASIVTYPVLNYLLLVINFFFRRWFEVEIFGLTITSINIIAFLLEFVVVYVEYRILKYVFNKKYSNKKLLILSAIMNLASYLFGLLIFIPFLFR